MPLHGSRPVARYRPGQAPAYAASDSSSSGEEDVELSLQQERVSLPSRVTSAAPKPTTGTFEPSSAALDEYETDSEEAEEPRVHTLTTNTPVSPPPKPPRPLQKQALPPPTVTLGDSPQSETEAETESEDDGPMLKPVFVSRKKRASAAPVEHVGTTRRTAAEDEAEKQAAHRLAAARVVRDLQEQKHEETHSVVDDTDGLDPDAEFAAWRTRELARMERMRQAERMRAAEVAEVARRRVMPEHERLADDLAYARETRAAKQRGHQGFMQKYYHKGAFFQDMDILQRDYTHSTIDEVDKSQLPQVLQKRNFGKRGQSKWTHLAGEDTTRQSEPDLRLLRAPRRT